MEKKRRHNAVVMLEILLAGFPIRFKDSNQEYYYQDGIFGIRGQRITPGREGSEKVILETELSLRDFIKLCEEMSFEEVFIKGSEMVLTLYNRKDRVVKANG